MSWRVGRPRERRRPAPSPLPSELRVYQTSMNPRALLRSAAIWGGVAGVVCIAVPPMVLGYPLVLVDPNRAISDWYFRTLAKAIVRINPNWSISVVGKEKLAHGGPYVLVVNHQSFVDLIAMCFLDHPTKYLGKESVF